MDPCMKVKKFFKKVEMQFPVKHGEKIGKHGEEHSDQDISGNFQRGHCNGYIKYNNAAA